MTIKIGSGERAVGVVFADRDYERVLRSTTKFVAIEDCTAYLVDNVDDAIDHLEIADTLVVDLDGPDGPGWELLLLVSQQAQSNLMYGYLRSIVATPSLCERSAVRALNLHADAVMEKPVTYEIIRDAIFGADELTHVRAGASGSMTSLEAFDPGSRWR